MKKTKFLTLLLGVGLLIGGVIVSTIQFGPTSKTIKASEEERVNLLTEDWNILPSPFQGIAQLGVKSIQNMR